MTLLSTLRLRHAPPLAIVLALSACTTFNGATAWDEPASGEDVAAETAGGVGNEEVAIGASTEARGASRPSTADDEPVAPNDGESKADPDTDTNTGAGEGPRPVQPGAPSTPKTPVMSPVPSAPPSAARRVAAKLGRPPQLLVGLGNDAADLGDANKMHAYGLSSKVDIHYMYLSGLDWPSWNPNGGYVTVQANAAKARGITPMFTLYQAADWGDGNLSALDDAGYMSRYWNGVRTMFDRLGELDAPAIVHLEPDLWGYAQKKNGDSAAATAVKVRTVAECADLPNDISGMARCIVRLGRRKAPKSLLALSASSFGASDPARVGRFLNAIGGAETDIMVVETLDRDAGCFERAIDPNCQRSGSFYWDETNRSHPNFHDHLAWAKTIHETTGLPLLWWQMPLGRPSAARGGSPSAYRDNRVKYFFEHPEEFRDAGGVGAVFGKGMTNQTTVKTDGGQFDDALRTYRGRSPIALP